MISHELSMIQMNEPLSAKLAANIEAFLNVGGTIQELPGFGIVHRPPNYNRSMQYPPSFQSQAVQRETDDQVARVRKLARTMSLKEVCAEEALSVGVLRGIAKRNNIVFAGREKEFQYYEEAAPKEDVELIKKVSLMAETMTLSEVTAETGLSRSILSRMAKRYEFRFKFAQKLDSEAEAAMVLKIEECKKKGLNRNRARLLLGISSCLMTRIIKDHRIDYPVVTY